jgi:CO/xanthine dehydrogenase Mo-binding subunit
MPRIGDVPGRHKVYCVETPEVRGPYGARCIAEHPMVAVTPAILNALQDALGHDFFHVPVTAGEIQKVLGGDG